MFRLSNIFEILFYYGIYSSNPNPPSLNPATVDKTTALLPFYGRILFDAIAAKLKMKFDAR